MAFTEFCCRSGGSNMNGGGDHTNGEPGTSALYSATNGGWNSSTGVYTPTAGNPSLTVTVGDFAHVFTDGSTTPTFIARVTAVNTTTITLSTTAKDGTAPTTAGTGISINVGGAWQGPNGAVGFPFTFVSGNLTDANGNGIDRMRINFKNDQTYSVTAAININPSTGSCLVTFQGYSSTFGDGGRATVDGGTTGASYTVITLNNNCLESAWTDLIFQNNGSTGSADLFSCNRLQGTMTRCTFKNSKNNGFSAPFSNGYLLVECEAYNNTFNGFSANVPGVTFVRCIASGNTNHGFNVAAGVHVSLINCLSVGNGQQGFMADGAGCLFYGCDAFNNGQNGFFIGWNSYNTLINCNSAKNALWGIQGFTSSTSSYGSIVNCGFGSGTFANTSGTTSTTNSTTITGSVTYGAPGHPWTDPTNGDFRIALAAAENTGWGAYLWTDTNYSGRANNVAFPDIGAEQHQATGGATNPVGQNIGMM